MKNIYKKTLTIGIFILFAGLIIAPAINAISLQNNERESIELQNNIFKANNGDYDLLIVTPKKFVRALKPLLKHKEQIGVNTKLSTLDEIYEEEYWGRDNAEKIKFYIKNAYDLWGIKYVLLVGGKIGQLNRWHCPVRYIYLGNNWERKILSDTYFADIYDSEGNYSSWDSDGDGRYGEWFYGQQPEDKFIDRFPEIGVGRLPCRNRFELRFMVKKIIKYEKTTYGQPWFNDMIAIAGDTYPEYANPKWAGNEGEYYADLAFENMTGFNQIKLYCSEGTLTGPREICPAISKGSGFVYFVGHGSAMSWNTHFPNDKNRTERFTLSHIARLMNFNKLPICVVSGCHNSQFDCSIFKFFNATTRYHLEFAFECFSWLMTRKIGGGSVATLGCTALGHTKEDKPIAFNGGINELEVQFFKQYGQNEIEILGDTWKEAVKWYVETYPVDWNEELTNESWVDQQVSLTWVLFGDPSMKIGGYPPSIT